MPDYNLPWFAPSTPALPQGQTEPQHITAAQTSQSTPTQPTLTPVHSQPPPGLPPPPIVHGTRPTPQQVAASSYTSVGGRQLMGPFLTRSSVPFPRQSTEGASSSTTRQQVQPYEAPVPQAASRIEHYRGERRAANSNNSSNRPKRQKTNSAYLVTVALVPLSCSHPKCRRLADLDPEGSRLLDRAMDEDEVEDLINELVLHNLTFVVDLTNKAGLNMLKTLHHYLMQHLKRQHGIVFPQLNMDNNAEHITGRSCGWCVQQLNRRRANVDWPRFLQAAHAENGMTMNDITKKTFDSLVYNRRTGTQRVLFIRPALVNISGSIAGFTEVRNFPHFTPEVAVQMHICYAERLLYLLGFKDGTFGPPPTVKACTGDEYGLPIVDGVVVQSSDCPPWIVRLTAMESANITLNRPISPDLPELWELTSGAASLPTSVDARMQLPSFHNSSQMDLARTPTEDDDASYFPQSPIPTTPDASYFPQSPFPTTPDADNSFTERAPTSLDEPPLPAQDVDVEPPFNGDPGTAVTVDSSEDDEKEICRSDDVPREELVRAFSSYWRELPIRLSDRITIKGPTIDSLARGLITLLQTASLQWMKKNAGVTVSRAPPPPPQLEDGVSVTGPFWDIGCYAYTNIYVKTPGGGESHGKGVFINTLRVALVQIMNDPGRGYVNLPNDSPLLTPRFPSENTPFHVTCVRDHGEGALLSLLLLISDGNADVSPFSPFLTMLLAGGKGNEDTVLNDVSKSTVFRLEPRLGRLMRDYLNLRRGQRMVDPSNRRVNHMLQPIAVFIHRYTEGVPVRLQDATDPEDLLLADVHHRRILKCLLTGQPDILQSPNYLSMQAGFQHFAGYTKKRGFNVVNFFTSLFDRHIKSWEDIEAVCNHLEYNGSGTKGSVEGGDYMEATEFADIAIKHRVEGYLLASADLKEAIRRSKDLVLAATMSDLVPMAPISISVNSYLDTKLAVRAQVCMRSLLLKYTDCLEDIVFGDVSALPADAYGAAPGDKVGFDPWFNVHIESLADDARKGVFSVA